MIFFRCGISWDFTSQECFRSIYSVDHGHGGYRCRRGLLVGVQGTLRVDARDHEVTTKTDSASKVSYLTSDVCIWVEIVKRCQELQDLKKKKHAKHPKSTTIRRYEIFPMTFWDFTRFDCLGEASHRFWWWDSLPNRFWTTWGAASIYAESNFVAPVLAPGRWQKNDGFFFGRRCLRFNDGKW